MLSVPGGVGAGEGLSGSDEDGGKEEGRGKGKIEGEGGKEEGRWGGWERRNGKKQVLGWVFCDLSLSCVLLLLLFVFF